MNKSKILTLTKFIYGSVFLLLLINHISGFQIKYFKYASSLLINKYHLEFGYYYMIFFELISLPILLVKSTSIYYKIYDFLFSIYIIFLSTCFLAINEITNGCIGCHYFASIYWDNYIVTLYFLGFLALIYLFIIRNKKFAHS